MGLCRAPGLCVGGGCVYIHVCVCEQGSVGVHGRVVCIHVCVCMNRAPWVCTGGSVCIHTHACEQGSVQCMRLRARVCVHSPCVFVHGQRCTCTSVHSSVQPIRVHACTGLSPAWRVHTCLRVHGSAVLRAYTYA